MINGINHITFAVSNLEKSLEFYKELLGLKLVARWPEGAYLKAGETWIALNLDPECRSEPSPDYTHIAFNVSPENFPRIKERLENANVQVFQENKSEGESFYFLDPDGHKLELHYNSLDQRLNWFREKRLPVTELIKINGALF